MKWIGGLQGHLKNESATTLYLLGTLFMALALLFKWTAIKDQKEWPPENELSVAQGQVTHIAPYRGTITFALSGHCDEFVWPAIYGRNWGQIESALNTPNVIIEVKFADLEQLDRNPECARHVVYSLAYNGVEVLTYQRSQEAFKENEAVGLWLVGFCLICAVFFFWQARLRQREEDD